MSSSSASAPRPPAWFERRHVPALAGLLFAAVFLLATRTEPVRVNWGDPWSDGNAMTSGRYFAEDGFVRTAFTPILDVGPLTPTSLRYTHYPPLPDLVNGVQRSVFGPLTISQFRILADLLSLLALVFFYRFVRRLTDPVVAGYAVLLMATNLLWLQYADTLHHVPLYTCFGYLALDQSGAWLDRGGRGRLWLIGGATALCALASYDFVFYLPVMAAAAVWLAGRGLRDREVRPLVIAIGSGAAAAIVIKFALIAWAVGVNHLIEDMAFQLKERSTTQHSTNYRAGLWPIVIGRIWRFFTPLFFVMVAALAVSGWRRYRTGTAPLSLTPLWFLAAGVPFCLVFTQLLVEQYHPTLQLLPFYAVGSAVVIVAMRRHGRRVVRAAGLAACLVLVAWQVRELVRFPKVTIAERDFEEVGAHLARVDHRRFVLSNFLVDGPVRAYWHRHLMGVPALNEKDADRYFRDLFAKFGNQPIRFVELDDAVDAAYDKLLFALLAGGQRWAWIAYPWDNRHKWRPKLEKANDELMEIVRARAVLEFTNRRFHVYRIDPEVGDRGWAIEMADDGDPDGVGDGLDLGEAASVRHKLHGLGPSAAGPDGVPAAPLTGRPLNDVRFTLQGLLTVPTGATEWCAAVQTHVLDGDGATLRVEVTGPAGATVTATVNGVALGAAPVAGGWQELSFPVEAAAVAESRRMAGTSPDVVTLCVDGVDRDGAVWIRRIRTVL